MLPYSKKVVGLSVSVYESVNAMQWNGNPLRVSPCESKLRKKPGEKKWMDGTMEYRNMLLFWLELLSRVDAF